jgi:hypothetical protein
MKALKLDALNIDVSPETIRNTFETVKFNQTVSRSNTSQDYYLSAMIEISSLSIEEAACHLCFFDSVTTALYQEEEVIDISFLPSGLLGKIKESTCAYLHVLFKKQLTYQGEQKNRVIIPIDDEVGYESDSIQIDPAGVHRLTAFMNRFIITPEKFWGKIPFPGYKALQDSPPPSVDRVAYRESA